MIRTIISFCFVSIFIGCSKTSNEIPSYLRVNKTTVGSATIGVTNSNIYGLDVTVDNDARGTWQIPFLMPILKDGIKNLVIKPIVKQNNLTTLFEAYPLYKTIVIPINLTRGIEVDTVLHFEYEDSVKATMSEDMEIKNNFSSSSLNSNAANGSFSLNLKADNSTTDSSAVAYYNKPVTMSQTKLVYLEFDYYMPEGAFTPVLTYEDPDGKRITIFSQNFLLPTKTWTHVYWNLTQGIRENGQSQYTPCFILTVRKDKTNAEVFIDNIKILEK
jgi:hypothetical protein